MNGGTAAAPVEEIVFIIGHKRNGGGDGGAGERKALDVGEYRSGTLHAADDDDLVTGIKDCPAARVAFVQACSFERKGVRHGAAAAERDADGAAAGRGGGEESNVDLSRVRHAEPNGKRRGGVRPVRDARRSDVAAGGVAGMVAPGIAAEWDGCLREDGRVNRDDERDHQQDGGKGGGTQEDGGQRRERQKGKLLHDTKNGKKERKVFGAG